MGERVRGLARPRIAAIATALPGAPHPQAGIVERMIALHALDAREARRLRALHRRTRIDARHSVLRHDWTRASDAAFFRPGAPPPTTAERMSVFAREAPRLAAAAAGALLAGGAPGARADEIDHLLVVTCTGFLAPGLDVHLVRALGLRPDVGRTLVGFQGCQAGLAALRVAAELALARPRSRTLLVCVELSTLHFQHDLTRSTFLANALFGDGASAALIEGPLLPRSGPALEIERASTHLLEDGEADMRWDIGDNGFTLQLSDRLPALLAEHVPDVLARANLPHTGTWAVHPGGAAILDRIERVLALDPDALADARAVLSSVGNLSSATIFFVLARILERAARTRAAEAVTALAFGPGVTIEIAGLRAVPGAEEDERWRSDGRTSRHAPTSAS